MNGAQPNIAALQSKPVLQLIPTGGLTDNGTGTHIHLSAVIITLNESHNITECINSVRTCCEDVVVVDSGSKDDTVLKALSAGAKVVRVNWENYGSSRNRGAEAALNDWILAFDADERISPEMAEILLNKAGNAEPKVYGFKRQSFFAGKKVRFGDWGRDKVFRLYNRRFTQWGNALVHEKLNIGNLASEVLPGKIIHYPVRKSTESIKKLRRYAKLSAHKYLLEQKRGSLLKLFFSPLIAFLHSYILLFGFLDGWTGLLIASHNAWYTWLKYKHLLLLQIAEQGKLIWV